jgi:hypothetical protein
MANEKSMLRSVLGAFVELDETSAPAATKQPVQAPVTQATPGSSTIQATAQTDSRVDDMVKALEAVITNRKTAYTTLTESANKLEAIIADKVTRFKAAFVNISSDGQRSLDSIGQAIEVHVRDIDGELLRFKAAAQQRLQTTGTELLKKATDAEAAITTATARIEALKAEIVQQEQLVLSSTETASQARTAASTLEAETASTVQAFEQAVETVKSRLQAEKSSLTNMLA